MIFLRCYPKVTDFLFELVGRNPDFDYRFLPVYSYGFWVAMGFFAASTLATMEMRRREKLGLLKGVEEEITVGEGPSIAELLIYFAVAFVICFKVFGVIKFQGVLSLGYLTLEGYLKTWNFGSWIAGFFGGGLAAGTYYYQRRKEQLPSPVRQKTTIFPSDNVGDLVIIAALLGVSGANFFNYLENPDDYANFWNDPIGSMFSGLSVYGGLIFAGLGFAAYAYWKKFNLLHFFDSVAPGFILANGIGRLGCQTSGDGDWGIANLHPKPDWFPQFLWSDTYAYHIISCEPGVDRLLPGCAEEHCCELAQAVYPTPIYEFIMCTVIFVILWSLRKKLTNMPGMVMTIFMMLIGMQRYTIEQFRDLSGRNTFLGGFRQSEIISIVLFVAGAALTAYLYKRYKQTAKAGQ
jgi:phosphatidylglycerol:prolipoprotein diacylglycerol transferase